MKTTITFFLLLSLAASPLASQTISESLINLKESYSPILSSESAIISMNFVKFYDVGQPDTTYRLIIEVTNKTIEQDIFTWGWILGRFTYSNTYVIASKDGSSAMDYDEFIQFYDCLRKVYNFISEKAAFKVDKKNLVATCGVSNLYFGGEYNPSRFNDEKVASFYLNVGEDTTYEMKKKQFETLTRTLAEIKMLWDSKK